ncbi:MAG: hypothetical protein B7Z45_08345 [Azorhizobium sp. 12-66-6]|nr:MAG: hypothetical protein B7Z45_08345 [Azorhizobium sp. 12-66-6]
MIPFHEAPAASTAEISARLKEIRAEFDAATEVQATVRNSRTSEFGRAREAKLALLRDERWWLNQEIKRRRSAPLPLAA